VLNGEVIASKSYPSPYRIPDDLHGGEMSMVNETLDLIDKETIEVSSLREIRERAKG